MWIELWLKGGGGGGVKFEWLLTAISHNTAGECFAEMPSQENSKYQTQQQEMNLVPFTVQRLKLWNDLQEVQLVVACWSKL